MTLSGTLEDYLEAISKLSSERGYARARDIAGLLSVHKSTVTAALKSLSDKELVNYSPYEAATLTDKGERIAVEIIRRHDVIQRFLTEVLLVEEETAEANACRIEHAIDQDVLDRLLGFIGFVQECPRGGDGWLRSFAEGCMPEDTDVCLGCIRRCLQNYEEQKA